MVIYSYLQLPPDIEMWLRILAVAIPAIVALITPLVTYRWLSRRLALYQGNLNKELEDYRKVITKELETHKKDLSKELESYRIQLQSEFQTTLYEFQTKFSLLQQRKAEVLEKVFELLAKVYQDLQYWELYDGLSRKRMSREELYKKMCTDFDNFVDYFDHKRIYLDVDIRKGVLVIVDAMQMVLSLQNLYGQSPPPMLMRNIHSLMNTLEVTFKKALEVQRLQGEGFKQLSS